MTVSPRPATAARTSSAVAPGASSSRGSGGPNPRSTAELRRGAGCELVTRLRGAEPQIDSRLSCSEQRGRKHRIRLDSVGAELLPEATGLLVALGREGAQLVRAPWSCGGMANEDEQHGAVG